MCTCLDYLASPLFEALVRTDAWYGEWLEVEIIGVVRGWDGVSYNRGDPHLDPKML